MSKFWGKFVLSAFCFLMSVFATAQTTPQKVSASPHYDNFYTVSEQPVATANSMDPAAALQSFVDQQWIGELKVQVYNLLNFDHHQGDYGVTPKPYNRLKDFGTWIRDPSGQTCYNTRARVLIRDSAVAVSFTSSHCTVSTGDWQEPYTGREVTKASDLQIDHVVPLKNAYISGAANWDYAKRCLYANFMGNDFHLLSTDAHENMKKSDSGPEGYLPPDNAYKCAYLQHWVRIKMIWQLQLNPDEVDAIEKDIAAYNCDPNDFLYSVADLQAQRQYMQDNSDMCGPH